VGSNAQSEGFWNLNGNARAPLLVHVALHFFVGGGPGVGVKLASSPDAPAGSYGFGFNSTLGGWF
jgi:hypothetical protein